MADLLKKLFFDDVQTKNWPKLVFFGPPSQSIGRGRVSREGALDHRESPERRDKIFAAQTVKRQNFQNKIWIRKTVFSGNFHFLAAGKLTFWGGV